MRFVPRPRPVVCGLALVTIVQAAPVAAAAALQVSAPVKLPGWPGGMYGAADGSSVVVTGPIDVGRVGTSVTTVPPRGPARTTATLLPASASSDRPDTAVTSVDAVAAYPLPGATSHAIAVASLPRDARAATRTTVSTPGRLASAPELVTAGGAANAAGPGSAAGTGSAIGVLFEERDRGGPSQPMWTQRGPGSWRFTRPVALDAAGLAPRPSYTAAIGPDGTGVVVRTPNVPAHPRTAGGAVAVRRVHADGSLGPWVSLAGPLTRSSEVAVAAGPDGTVTMVLSLIVPNPDRPKGPTTSVLETAVIAPGADTPGAPRPLITGTTTDRFAADSFSVAAGPRGAVLLAVVPNTPHSDLALYEGNAGGDLRNVAHFHHTAASGPMAIFTRDGGATVIWRRLKGFGPWTVLGSHRTATGRFSRPQLVAKPRLPKRFGDREAAPWQLVPLGGGAAALTYLDEDTVSPGPYENDLITIRPTR